MDPLSVFSTSSYDQREMIRFLCQLIAVILYTVLAAPGLCTYVDGATAYSYDNVGNLEEFTHPQTVSATRITELALLIAPDQIVGAYLADPIISGVRLFLLSPSI